MRSLKLTVAYDGTEFSGWQRQPGRRTVQGVVEAAWHKITGEAVDVTVSGRTDAGVHALGQVVGVDTASLLNVATIQRALNASMPADVVVRSVEEAARGFHATNDTIRKRYRYVVHTGQLPDLFGRKYAWYLREWLDVAAMQRAAEALLGKQDFASFQSAGSPRHSTVRTIFDATVQGRAGEWGTCIVIEVEGDGFLYNMVRTIAGSLVRVGRGKNPPRWLTEVITAHDRSAAGPTAPPHGLFLVHVTYP